MTLSLERDVGFEREGNANDAGVAGFGTDNFQLAMVGFDNFAADRQTQPQPNIARRKEWSGSLLHRFRSEAGPIILNLDLQGGMNVTMEVSIGDLIRSLSNNSADPTFNKAIEVTNEKIKKSRKDYNCITKNAIERYSNICKAKIKYFLITIMNSEE